MYGYKLKSENGKRHSKHRITAAALILSGLDTYSAVRLVETVSSKVKS